MLIGAGEGGGVSVLVPLLEFSSSLVSNVDVNLTVLVASIQSLAAIIRNLSPSNCKHVSLSEIKLVCILSPKSDLNGKTTLICNRDLPLVLRRTSILRLERGSLTNILDDSSGVYDPVLLKIVDLIDGNEVKALVRDLAVIIYLLDA